MYPEILYEDNHIIVVVKPADIPVQEDSSGDMDMLSLLKAYIKEKYNKPGNVYLGLVHRLDRPVGGVMVFAKTSKAASRLTESFKKLSAHKKYVAIVCGKPRFKAQLEDYMRKDEKNFSAVICSKQAEGAKLAQLEYTSIATKSKLTLVDVTLKTGRHHQIRLQMSNNGTAIYGDHRYNKQFINESGTHIALFAYSLTLEHPTTHEQMSFCALPKGDAWDMFSQELISLKNGIVPVYIDNNIIVCDKPKGESVAMADGDPNNLESKLCTVFDTVIPVHRLDATTDGLVMFARNEKTAELLSEALSQKEKGYINKYYLCTVIGKPKEREARLYAYLIKDEQHGTVAITDRQKPGAKPIETHYSLLGITHQNGYILSQLEVKLITGRTHQIRAHLAYEGLPLLGDDKYGNREVNKQLKARKIALRSQRLEFDFPKESPLYYLNNITIGE